MITLDIKITYDPVMMNGSLSRAHNFLFKLIKSVKKKTAAITGLKYSITTDSNVISPWHLTDPFLIAVGVFKHENIPIEFLNLDTRKREIVEARQIAMFISYKRKNKSRKSLQSIADVIGEKDHATVLHAVKVINNLCDTDKKFKARVNEIERKV
jgi:chromosomal replication initiation ATPase DnaA